MSKPRLLAFGGSLRQDSFNHRIVEHAAAAARDAGAAVTVIRLRDYPLPLYDADVEADGKPEAAGALKHLFIEHDGFLIASPEYNGSLSGALKNAIDWASRPDPDEKPLIAFKGKVAGIMAASPGALGGLRGLAHLRQILSGIGVLVVPEQHAVSHAHDVFAENGRLGDPHADRIADLSRRVLDVAGRLR